MLPYHALQRHIFSTWQIDHFEGFYRYGKPEKNTDVSIEETIKFTAFLVTRARAGSYEYPAKHSTHEKVTWCCVDNGKPGNVS